MKILFGTSNPGKIKYMKNILKDFPFEIININEINVNQNVEEIGSTPRENARIKAMHYYNQSKLPTFAIDSGLWLDKFPDDMQPGVYVRRVNNKVLTDEELLEHMVAQLNKVGGESLGHWRNSICFILDENNIIEDTIDDSWIFRNKIYDLYIKGEPLTSIQYHKVTNEPKVKLKLEEKSSIDMEMSSRFIQFFERVLN